MTSGSAQDGAQKNEFLSQTISERVQELPMFESDNEKDAGKEIESQRISEKETDTLSDFSSGSLEKSTIPPVRPTVKQTPIEEELVPQLDLDQLSTQNNNIIIKRPKLLTKDELNNPSLESTKTFVSIGDVKGRDSPTSSNDSLRSSLNMPSFVNVASHEPILEKPRQEVSRIKIKRPRDHIRQWENTMDRLSGEPSPRTFTPKHIHHRSRSLESSGSPVSIKSSHVREYSSEHRSRSSDVVPRPIESFRPTIKSIHNSSENAGLQTILDRLPEDMQQQAKSASNFLMQTNEPNVVALIDAIKSAKETSSGAVNEVSEETDVKQVQQTQSARVRFQPKLSPRVQALKASTSNSHGEKGAGTMLSISPRDQPKSLSSSADLSTKSPLASTDHDSDTTLKLQAVREKILMSSLGVNTRVIEDERPSSRLKTLSNSTRNVNYVSQIEDSDSSEAPQRGGIGRVPRREAWEQQRKVSEEQTHASNGQDSPSQSRFIEVLCKEIEVLKQKVEMMEDEEVRRSRSQSRTSISPGPIHSPQVSTPLRADSLTSRINSSRSPSRSRCLSCPLLQTSSRSSMLRSSNRNTSVYSTTTNRSSSIPASIARSISPGREISPSPARSVSPVISDSEVVLAPGLDPEKQDNWKRLVSIRNLSEFDVRELKNALACAIVEHDILTSKLNNARHEIHDKMRHTNEVLEDCRHHLAKSQAENMELRSKVEQERQRSEQLEIRLKEMEGSMTEVRHFSYQFNTQNRKLQYFL